MRLRQVLSFALLIALAASLAGCDSIKKAMSKAPIINHVTIAAKVGDPGAAVQGKLTPGAPSNLPLWAGAGVVRSGLTKSDAGKAWSATLSTTDVYDDVLKGMAAGFQNNGWKTEMQDITSAEGSTTVLSVSASTGEGIVTIAAQKDKTTRIGYAITLPGK